VIARTCATAALGTLGLVSILVACSPKTSYDATETSTTQAPATTVMPVPTGPGPSTTTTDPLTLEEVCGADQVSLADLLESDAPFVPAAQAAWEEEGGRVLGCFQDALAVGVQRLLRFVTGDGAENAVFAAATGIAHAVPVHAPFTDDVEEQVRTGQVAQVRERLVVDETGLATLVGRQDGSCRLVLALVEPVEGRLVETFDDWETAYIISRVRETESHSIVAQEVEPGVHHIRMVGPDGDAVLEVSDAGITEGVLVGDPSEEPEPCPYGWWDEIVTLMGD
jgi:hypothetical protein